MALPNTGITTTMVGQELGLSTRNVGNLCRSEAINKWSKWKPVPFNKVTGITENELQSINFGLQPSSPSTNYATVVAQKWGYDRPTGGGSSPYRLGDFRNYNKDALAICQAPEKIEVNLSVSTRFRSYLSLNIGGTSDMIGLNDFSGVLGDLYYCTIIDIPSRSNTYIVTSGQTLENGGNSIDVSVPVQARLSGTVGTVYHVLSITPVTSFTLIGSAPPNTYYSLPSADDQTNTSIYEVKQSPIIGEGDYSLDAKGISTIYTGIPDNIDDYLGIGKPSFQTFGNIFVKYKLKNVSSFVGIFEGYDLLIGADPTFFGANSNKFKAYMYDLNGNIITSIQVQPNQEVEFVIGATNVMNRDGMLVSTPTPGTEIYSNISIYKNASGTDTLVSGIGLTFIA